MLLDPSPSPLHAMFLITLRSGFIWHPFLGEKVLVNPRRAILAASDSPEHQEPEFKSIYLTQSTGYFCYTMSALQIAEELGRCEARRAQTGRARARTQGPPLLNAFVACCGIQQPSALREEQRTVGFGLLIHVCFLMAFDTHSKNSILTRERDSLSP